MALSNRMAKREVDRANVLTTNQLPYLNQEEPYQNQAEIPTSSITQNLYRPPITPQLSSQYTLTPAFTNQQIMKLKECFEDYSSLKKLNKHPKTRLNASGVREIVRVDPKTEITLFEKGLADLFEAAGLPLLPLTVSHIYSQIGGKKGKGISFSDLMSIMDLQDGSKDSQSDYEQIFRQYDRRNRGYFDYEDYKLVCERVSKKLTEGQIQNAFNSIDLDKTGKVNLHNFVAVMRGWE